MLGVAVQINKVTSGIWVSCLQQCPTTVGAQFRFVIILLIEGVRDSKKIQKHCSG